MKDLSNYRISYDKFTLDEGSLSDDPLLMFRNWFDEVRSLINDRFGSLFYFRVNSSSGLFFRGKAGSFKYSKRPSIPPSLP